MPNNQGSFDDNEWTPEERARLGALSADRLPPAELKHRTASALRERGLLRGEVRLSSRVVIGLLLAASVVFAVGALVGYAAANRRPAVAPETTVAATREVAKIDSPPAPAKPARHVVWY
jgi:hypothetical protein